MKQQSLKSNRG